ncbi:unnamed protein product [Gordionus sp. m RMFG-2023]
MKIPTVSERTDSIQSTSNFLIRNTQSFPVKSPNLIQPTYNVVEKDAQALLITIESNSLLRDAQAFAVENPNLIQPT